MTQKIYYQHKFRADSIKDALDIVSRIADVKSMERFKYDEDPFLDIVLVCELDNNQLANLMWGIVYGAKMLVSLKTTKYNSQAYRDDEIVLIYMHCKTIDELNEASRAIGFLTISGHHIFRPVVPKLYMMRYQEILKRNYNV